MRILVIDNDTATVKRITPMLSAEGYVCDNSETGEDGLDIARHYDYDLIVLGLELPDLEGETVIRRLREAGVQTPLLALAPDADPHRRARALIAGADDCLSSPFDIGELLARAQAIVRRCKGFSTSIIQSGRMSIRLDSHTVEIDGQPVRLTRKEYEILELLALRRGTTLSKEAVFNHLYNGIDEPELKIVDVFVCKIRKKLVAATGGENMIRTVWGRGYQLAEPEMPEMRAAS